MFLITLMEMQSKYEINHVPSSFTVRYIHVNMNQTYSDLCYLKNMRVSDRNKFIEYKGVF